MAMNRAQLVARFREARRDPAVAVLEGFHPLKHGLRFGASVEVAVSPDPERLARLAADLAPDTVDWIRRHVAPVDAETFAQLAPVPPATGVIAIARRPPAPADALLSGPRSSPLVVLENPSHLDNVGASIRVAAAAGASGVVVLGPQDPWHPAALRGSAGLHYALPVARADALPPGCGPLLALDPQGEPLAPGSIPDGGVLAFGSERRGLSDALRARADRILSIPMEPGVSSLNLATATAVVLYTWRLHARPPATTDPSR